MVLKSLLKIICPVLCFCAIGSITLYASSFSKTSNEENFINSNPYDRIMEIKSQSLTSVESSLSAPKNTAKFSIGDESWRLPFAGGSRVYQDQGYDGSFSHKGTYALDMRSPNSMIVSARNGTVAAINFDGKWDQWCNSNTDCYNKGGVWRGNHILINHSDGSTSYYLHMRGGTLQPGLWVGKYIDQGTPLGIEGYTGYTCLDLVTPCNIPDPHIHFQVNKNGVSVPTPFEDCNLAGNQCQNGIPIEGATNTSTNIPSNAQNNQYTSKINYFGSQLAIKTSRGVRGETIILGNENETVTSRWLWFRNGEIKGVNDWCLAAENNQIVLRDCNGRPNQKFYWGANNSIRSQESNQCWDSASGDTYGSRVYLFSCHGGANQRWRIGEDPYEASEI
jgi:murein DD-endopeptidase MepM/ murein hydrolase activator NlpD